MFLAIYEDLELFKGGEGFLRGLGIALVAIIIVFLILLIIILSVNLMQYIIKKFAKNKVETNDERVIPLPTNVKETPRQQLTADMLDEDMMVAALVATVEFTTETQEDARLVSIKRVG